MQTAPTPVVAPPGAPVFTAGTERTIYSTVREPVHPALAYCKALAGPSLAGLCFAAVSIYFINGLFVAAPFAPAHVTQGAPTGFKEQQSAKPEHRSKPATTKTFRERHVAKPAVTAKAGKGQKNRETSPTASAAEQPVALKP